MPDCRAQQLDEREAAIAAREERVGGGMESDFLAETLQAMPNGHGQAGSREVCLAFAACYSQEITFRSYKVENVCLVTITELLSS